MKHLPCLLALLACATGAGSAGAQVDPPVDTALHAHLNETAGRAAAVLAKRQDADSQAAAALLWAFSRKEQAADAIARATAAAPDRADLAWLRAQLCLNTDGCPRDAAYASFRAVAPRNGAGWLADIAAARQDDEIDRLLGLIGDSERVDLYWNALISRLSRAIIDSKAMMTANEAVASVIGNLAAIGIPAFQGVSRPCQGEALQREGRTSRCRAVAAALQRGDTVIAEMMGASMTLRLWPEGAPEVKAARDARRTHRYRSGIATEFTERMVGNDEEARDYVEQLGRVPREQDMIRAQVIAANRSPDAPADWVAPYQ